MKWLVASVIQVAVVVSCADASRISVVSTPGGGNVPDAEIDGQGVIHLAYFADGNVFYVKSTDWGATFTEPIRVNTEENFASGGRFRGPDLAVGRDGSIHIAWYNAAYQQKRPKDEWGVMYSRKKRGGTAFDVSRNLNHRPSDNYSLATDGQGQVAVVWMAGGVFVNISENGGDSFASAVDLKTDPCECCASRASYVDNGALSVFYRDKANNDRDMFLALRLPRDTPFRHVKTSKSPWFIEACPMTGCYLSRAADGLVASWETKGRIYFARLDASGNYLSKSEIQVSDAGRYPVARTAADGQTAVAWKNGNTLHWQLFGANDQPLDEHGTVEAQTSDRPAGVVDREGNFLLFP